nr:uncharacterized protein LOC124813734 isoform X1 [Hydra vulgaris]
MNSVNIKNNSENQTFGVLQNADEQERTFLIEKKHENSFKSNNDLILSIRDKENQLIQKEDDFSTENSLNSMLPNYKSLIEKFIIDEPPKFEVVTGKKLNFEVENLNNGSIFNNNSRPSARCEKIIKWLIFGFSLFSMFAVIAYGFINRSTS